MSLYGLVGVVALGGVATALQAHFMGILDKRIGTLESVFITYFGGGLLIGRVHRFCRRAVSDGCVGRSLRLDERRGAALESRAPSRDGAPISRDMADHEELTRSDVHASTGWF
jgi:hypothetical protein